MKKLVVAVCLIIGTMSILNAQDISKHAIGIRFGNNDGFNSEISFQKKLSNLNRFEIDLGYRNTREFDAFKLTGVYQWLWNIDQGLNWYAGFGAGIGSWNYNKNVVITNDDGVFLNADGIVGIEYNFEIPLLISIDFRPEFSIFGDYGKDSDIALSLRYQFN